MGVHPAPGLSASAPVEQYLARLPLTPERRAEILARAAAAPNERARMTEMHAAIAGGAGSSELPAMDSLAARLALAVNGAARSIPPPAGTDLQGHARLVTTPPFNRASMAPQGWLSNPFPRRTREGHGPHRPGNERSAWARSAAIRRLVLLVLVIAQTVVATSFMADVLPYKGERAVEMAVICVFAILFAWISSGFWTALAGFGVLLVGRDRYAIARTPVEPLAGATRTAIVMPICNEDVGRVLAGLRATCESIIATGEARHFEVFILSDSGDPDMRVAEIDGWLELRQALGADIGIHYRWRQHHIKRKSGNIADFCRRWGRNYDHMVVLDADSVMTGECLVRLAQLMEADPGAGIIQTAPRAFGRETLFARIQQFATAAYGPIFTAGLHFWQLGEAHYWGHNAIIRVDPFMRHCALGRLPGDGALSGEILSHDFVEAALMRRAGWGVWIAYDLPGSYEEVPPNLIDELARDRRWCLGNLMNLRLMRLEGVHPAHRAVFMIGVMSYLSAPLWFLALALGTALLAQHTLVVPEYFTQPHQLYPIWPEWHPEMALALFGSTAFVLFLPKVLSAVLIWVPGHGEFGPPLRVAAGVLVETIFSALFAPVRMLFHTQFVVTGVAGISLHWKSPPRADTEISWARAVRRHGVHTLIGLAWIALVWYLDPRVLPWILPVAGALALSIPLSVATSRVQPGLRSLRAGLFVTPEERNPPLAVRRTLELARAESPRPGLTEAVMDPLANALAAAQGTPRERAGGPAREERGELVKRALTGGLEALDRRARHRLLNDPLALAQLHFDAWTSPLAHESWQAARAPAVTAA